MKSNHRFPKRSWLACATAAALASAAFSIAPSAVAATVISVRIAPPPLPVYAQPEIPGPGYLWTPGYWAWDGDSSDYYWVPGTWVQPPSVGLLWTPGYWGWSDSAYVFHAGYWGPHVGYYGGINYGFGYVGVGYAGGEWRHGSFYYNTAVNHFGSGVHITNVYDKTVVNVTVNHYSFNGPGGVDHRPTRAERDAEHEHHTAPVEAQVEHRDAAQHDTALHASSNHGSPPITATSRPEDLKSSGENTAGADAKGNESSKADARASAQSDMDKDRGSAGAEASSEQDAGRATQSASAKDEAQRTSERERVGSDEASTHVDQGANAAANPPPKPKHQKHHVQHHAKSHPANSGNPPPANASPRESAPQMDSQPHDGNLQQQRPANPPKEPRQPPKEDRKPHDNSGDNDHHDH